MLIFGAQQSQADVKEQSGTHSGGLGWLEGGHSGKRIGRRF